jgi:hypothetical protein
MLGLLVLALTVVAGKTAVQSNTEPQDQGVVIRPTSTIHRGSHPSAAELVKRAFLLLASPHSISAKIQQDIHLFGTHLVGSGVYLEQSDGRLFLLRLETRIQLGEKACSFLDVSDGRYLWSYQKIREEEKLKRIDLLRVQQQAEELGELDNVIARGWHLQVGGLTKLIGALNAWFDFHTVQATSLHQLPAWRLAGRWKPKKLALLLPEQADAIEAGKPADLDGLPAHVPDHVVLLLGQDDYFPYQIEYRRQDSGDGSKHGAASSRTLVSILFHEVSSNVQLAHESFVYNPGELEPIDDTRSYLRRMTEPLAR